MCVRNRAQRPATLYGAVDAADRASSAFVDGRPAVVDLDMAFDGPPRALVELLPRMAESASLFRFAGAGPWLYALVGVAVCLLAPACLLLTVRAAAREEHPGGGGS